MTDALVWLALMCLMLSMAFMVGWALDGATYRAERKRRARALAEDDSLSVDEIRKRL